MMRILIKIILFPVRLALTVIILLCQFLLDFSVAVLSVISVVLLVVSLGTLVFLGDPPGALGTAVLAFAISPYGIPRMAIWLVSGLEGLNSAIKAI